MSRWRRLWRNLVHRDSVERELHDELDAMFELLVAEHVRSGLPEAEARRRAALKLGGIEVVKERVRDIRRGAAFETLMQDVRYALRLLRRSPGFTAVALLTLALGIGANTTMFGIVNGVLLRPLPYPDAERLVRVYLSNAEQGVSEGQLSPPDFDDWRQRTRTSSQMAAFSALPVIVAGRGDAAEIQTAFVLGGFFETMGVPPRLGRLLVQEDVRNAAANAVISERLWNTRFGSDPGVVGGTINLFNRPYTIVGVMPADFRYPRPETDLWAPRTTLTPEEIGEYDRHQRVLDVIARLAPGATLEQARAELSALARQAAVAYPDTNRGWDTVQLIALRRSLTGDIDTALLLVLGMVGVTLLIGCVNLANLMLARGPARASEIAIRTALGAGRGRIVRQILTESVVLAFLGGILGITLAAWGIQGVLALSADTLPRVHDVRIDARVAAFGVLLAVVTGALFGVLPAMRAARAMPHGYLHSSRGTVGRGVGVRNALVVAEVALAMVLVIAAALMARSFSALRSVDPGFEPDRVLTLSIMINITGADDIIRHIVDRRRAFIDRIAALPGVTHVGAVNSLPLDADLWEWFEFYRADGSGMPDGSMLRADRTYVDGGYLQAMGIPLVRGQLLPTERTAVPRGAPIPFLINETAARRYWPNEDPVGQLVRAPFGPAVIAGIVGDVRHLGLSKAPTPAVYFPHFLGPRIVTTVVARTDGDPAALAASVRQVIRDIDPNQPVRSIAPLREVMADSIARDRFFTVVFVVFGTLALVLAVIGVYGVLAYAVGQRTSEIGVRMALGARAADILGMVMGSGMRLVVAGIAVGAIAALFLTQLLASQLYSISANDPVTFVAAPLGIAAVALLACYVPARRAIRIEPTTALRQE